MLWSTQNNLNAAKSPHHALEAVVKQVVDSNLELYVFFGIDVFVDILTMAWKMLSSSRCMWKSLTVSRGTTMISRTLKKIFLLDLHRMGGKISILSSPRFSVIP